MKSNGIIKLMMGALVAVVLLITVGSTTADAHGRGFRRPNRVIFYRPYRPFYRPYWVTTYRVVDPIAAAKEEGYSDGRSRGKDDAKEGRENDPENHKQFNKSKSLAYREAFLQGYADGYNKQHKKAEY
ncbi:MAG: hypothetical protein MOB07_25275 [Acidobacteria bacterium]|nr:hypothetical protein [Acidobacteriota bacterium]